MEKSIQFLDSIKIDGDYIIVGCSGGPDSMCLLELLYRHKYKAICAHVNHNIRDESDDEELFLKEFCEKKGIVFERVKLEKIDRGNEEIYRKKRYDFYKSLADKYKTKYIFTAHHGDDLTETILMRITRGSNLKGFSGFSKIYEEGGYTFVKPLIFYTKEELAEYLKKNDIPYVIDKTNGEDDYTRNRYRHHVLPFLKKENPNVHGKFLSFSEELLSIDSFIEREVKKAVKKNYRDGSIDLKLFLGEDELIQKKELEFILRDIYKDKIFSFKNNYANIVMGMLKKGSNFHLDLPAALWIEREYDVLSFRKSRKNKTYRIEFDRKAILPNGDIIELVKDSEDKSNFTTRLNSEEISLPLYIRTRKSGDKIVVKGMEYPKKIKEIFIDEKIPRSMREIYPLVEDSNGEIIWLPGLRKSKFDNENYQKYDIILRYTKKKGNNE